MKIKDNYTECVCSFLTYLFYCMPKLKHVSTGLILSMHNRFTPLCEELWNGFYFFFWPFLVLAPILVGDPGQQIRPDLSLFQSPSLPANAAWWTMKILRSALSASYDFEFVHHLMPVADMLLFLNKVSLTGFAGLLLASVWTSSHLAYISSKQWCFQRNSQTLYLGRNWSVICWSWVNEKQAIA